MVHELHQEADGTLRVSPLPEVLDAFGPARPVCPRPLCGQWRIGEDALEADAPYSYASLLLAPMTDTCRLSLDVEILDETAQLGVALHVDERFAEGYYAIVDPFRRRVEYKTAVRMTERGGQKFPYEVEMERPLSPFTDNRFHLDVLVDGSVLIVYVDDRIALGTRMLDRQGDSFGLFVSEGRVRFSNVKIASA